MNHDAEQLLGAYALGALDHGELEALERHLEGCSSCQAQLGEYQQVADGLLHLTAVRMPGPALRARLAEVVAGGRLPDARESSERAGHDRAAGRFRWPQAAWAGLGVVLVAVNLYLFAQLRTLSARTEELLSQQRANQTALAVMSYPNSRVANLEQDSLRGSFTYDDQIPLAVLNVWGLPLLPAEQSYQLWLIQDDGSRASGGLLSPTGDSEFVSLVVWSPVSFESVQGIGITVEPAGGSSEPSGPRVLGTDLIHSP